MKVIPIILPNGGVELVVKDKFNNIVEKVQYTDRIITNLTSRWDFAQLEIERYFVENGMKGCYLGEFYRKHTKTNYEFKYKVWDLAKIFPTIKFKENTLSKEFYQR